MKHFVSFGWPGIIFLFSILWMSCFQMDWGHHFTFKNELGTLIDSLQITIGDQVNWVYPNADDISILEDNLIVPQKDYPHAVKILLFQKRISLSLEADSFNCYNCDGSHAYILRKTGAEYQFLN